MELQPEEYTQQEWDDAPEKYMAIPQRPGLYSVHAIHTTGFCFMDASGLAELKQRVPVKVLAGDATVH